MCLNDENLINMYINFQDLINKKYKDVSLSLYCEENVLNL